jgi:hypothetical protein
MMFCVGRLLADGTFESHHVQVVFTGGTHMSPAFGGGVVEGGVHTPLIIVSGVVQVTGGGVQTLFTNVSGAVQVGGVDTGFVQTPFITVLGKTQVGFGVVQTPFIKVWGDLQLVGGVDCAPVPNRATLAESKLCRLPCRPLIKPITSWLLTVPTDVGEKPTLNVALSPGSSDKGRSGPLTLNACARVLIRVSITLLLPELVMTSVLFLCPETATLPKLIADGVVPTDWAKAKLLKETVKSASKKKVVRRRHKS